MKLKDVVIGGEYVVRVSGKLQRVRILRPFVFHNFRQDRNGWVGLNVKTGREIYIKSAMKLRRELSRPASIVTVAPTPKVVVASPPQIVEVSDEEAI